MHNLYTPSPEGLWEGGCLRHPGSEGLVLLLLRVILLALLLVRQQRELVAPLVPAPLLNPCGGVYLTECIY